MTYNPSDWYWAIGDSTTDVWSSARAKSVPIGDADYTQWLIINHNPSTIASMDELYDIFRVQFPAGSLQTYNADARYRKASGGLMISSINTVPFLTDPISRNTINSAWNYVTSQSGSQSINWKFSDGSFKTLTEAQMVTVANAMASFVQSCFTKESENLAAITSGTITTIAQIDAAFATIPNTVP